MFIIYYSSDLPSSLITESLSVTQSLSSLSSPSSSHRKSSSDPSRTLLMQHFLQIRDLIHVVNVGGVLVSWGQYICKWYIDVYSRAVLEDDAFTRMKGIVKWYLSGFYKKPKGLKKPYNPILGETFRCYWKHPNGSRTFYLAEQVNADVYSHCRPLCYVWSTVAPVRKDQLNS